MTDLKITLGAFLAPKCTEICGPSFLKFYLGNGIK